MLYELSKHTTRIFRLLNGRIKDITDMFIVLTVCYILTQLDLRFNNSYSH